MKTLYQLLLDRWNQNCDTVLVTIVEGNGSIPRTTGAYMAADQTGRIYGTIGGGNLEYQGQKQLRLLERMLILSRILTWEQEKMAVLEWSVEVKVKVLFYSVKSKDTKIASFLKEALKMEEEKKPYGCYFHFQKDILK